MSQAADLCRMSRTERLRVQDWCEDWPADACYDDPPAEWQRETAKELRISKKRAEIADDRLGGCAWESLPPQLGAIRDAIDQSRDLLELEDDWDGEGSPKITEAVWQRSVEFLARYANQLWSEGKRVIDRPTIAAGPAGSVDLHWNYASYEMLINIPSDLAAPAGFYGDDRGNISIKGRFDPAELNLGLIQWLTKANRHSGK